MARKGVGFSPLGCCFERGKEGGVRERENEREGEWNKRGRERDGKGGEGGKLYG